MKLKLTIAIPTFNRKELLRECLNSIIPQYREGMEIYISDNASQDGTKEMIETEFNYHFIRYKRNNENVGSDRNFIQCFNNGQGEYLHMLSDDDLLLPGTVDALFSFFEMKPSMIYLNNCNIGDEKKIEINQNFRKFHEIMDFINYVGIYITFLSGIVLRKEYVDKVVNKERFINTNFPQSYVAIECLGMGDCAIVKETPGIAFRPGDAHGYNFYHVWGTEYLKLLGYLKKVGCNEREIKQFCIRTLNHDIVGFILGFRIYGTQLDMSGCKELLIQIRNMPQTWLPIGFAIFTPKKILVVASQIKHFILKDKNSV